ncbi:30S ribosomal protein S8e [archaeon]|nr:30S ribosomal protein S8e [archaeon]|tara:strand:+ start:3310 stop:3693 length:384 start_codon:yes stop_codon:yes gene_type:complete
MAIAQARSKKKVSGARYISFRRKKLRELGREPTLTRIGKRVLLFIRKKGGSDKNLLLNVENANVYDPKTKKHVKSKILHVIENKANANLVRRNIITKGCIVKTEVGDARITSRPGQEGSLNAILVKK